MRTDRSVMTADRPTESPMHEMLTLSSPNARTRSLGTPEQHERFNVVREQARLRAEQTHQQVLAVLTAEQRQQLQQKKEANRQKRENADSCATEHAAPAHDNTNDN
jgi:Spy/CpxP family protein refolding chaperone